jgi:hypothetical protein
METEATNASRRVSIQRTNVEQVTHRPSSCTPAAGLCTPDEAEDTAEKADRDADEETVVADDGDDDPDTCILRVGVVFTVEWRV